MREKLDLEGDRRSLTLDDVVDIIFGKEGERNLPQWMSCLKLRMKAVLGADEGNRLLSWEIDSFIEATLLLHFYQVSPEELWNPSNKDFYQTKLS